MAQFDLHDAYGRYFNREIAFNTLLQMQSTVNDRCEESEMKFHVKRAESHGKELPRVRVYLNELVVVMAGERAVQCGDMITTPRRSCPACFLSCRPSVVRAGPLSPASIANSGAPWEMKSAGSDGLDRFGHSLDLLASRRLITRP